MKLPKEFTAYTRELMGETCFTAFENAMNEDVPVSIRLNPFKLDSTQVSIKDKETDVPWCRDAMFL
ncbi:MAG: hypothetical protein ACFN4M_05150, partial [Segatella salivae]